MSRSAPKGPARAARGDMLLLELSTVWNHAVTDCCREVLRGTVDSTPEALSEALTRLEFTSMRRLAATAPSRSQYLIGLAGPGAVGKDTILEALIRDRKDAGRVLSTTTRQPRPHERDGAHYHFVSEKDFNRLAARRVFAYRRWIPGRGTYGLQRRELTKAFATAYRDFKAAMRLQFLYKSCSRPRV